MLVQLTEVSWEKYLAEKDPTNPHADRDRYKRRLTPIWVETSQIGMARIAVAQPPSTWKPEGTPASTSLWVMGEWLSVDETPERINALVNDLQKASGDQ